MNVTKSSGPAPLNVMRPDSRAKGMTPEERKVIIASSAGTVFEWYDFYLYGSLATTVIGPQFFSAYPDSIQAVFALLAFAAGFIVRPFGALVFGRLGDLIGRKYTFLVTILIMGLSTFLVGLLPNYETIGNAAPILLIGLRLLQGLALGGEYGGAATYVAEHAPASKRGYFTSWIQTTATLGLLLSLLVIMFVSIYVNAYFPPVTLENGSSVEAFKAWGWRIPFLLSILLLMISLYIRLQMSESPAFQRMKAEGSGSRAPLAEAFGTWKNAKIALLALLGLTAGQGVVWYTGQFYALFFLQKILKVDDFTANVLIAWALILATPFFVIFGRLSDRIGRKPIILTGCLIAALTYFPLFNALTAVANPALHHAQQSGAVVITADPNECSFQFNPTGKSKFTSGCDIAKELLTKSAAKYSTVPASAGTAATVTVHGSAPIVTTEPEFAKKTADALKAAGYPSAGDPNIIKIDVNPANGIANIGKFFDIFEQRKLMIIGILATLVLYVTMVYGPIAAALVELFPTRIRYSGMSLPYHIGNGWFGGLLPATAFAMVAETGDIYFGLWYPITIAAATAVVGFFLIPETYDRDLDKDYS